MQVREVNVNGDTDVKFSVVRHYMADKNETDTVPLILPPPRYWDSFRLSIKSSTMETSLTFGVVGPEDLRELAKALTELADTM